MEKYLLKKTGGFHRSLHGDLNSGISRENNRRVALDNYSWFLQEQWRENRHVKFYAITISPHDHKQPDSVVFNASKDIITICKSVTGLMYNFEESEKGKIHAHGILASKDYSKFLKIKKHPLCQFHIVEYTPGNWIGYCLKSNPPITHHLFIQQNKHYIITDRFIGHEQLNHTLGP